MEKLKDIREYLEVSDSDSLTYRIEDFEAMIKQAKDQGATYIELDSNYDSSDVDVLFFFEREETDDEFKERMASEESSRRYLEKRERETYERLKQKFG